MATFAASFRATVGPRLRARCRMFGTLIALDMETFGGAHDTVMDEAVKGGALALPRAVFAQLDDQVSVWLTEAVQPAILAVEFAADRAACVAGQWGGHERQLLR